MNTDRWLLLGAAVLSTGAAAVLAVPDTGLPVYVRLALVFAAAGGDVALALLRGWFDGGLAPHG